MKKLIVSALCAALTLSLTVTAFAAEPVLISPNPAADQDLEPQPGYALRIDGEDTGVRACVMVPLRAVAEKLGFTVTWNENGTILLDDGDMHAAVTIGEDRYQVITSNPDLVGMSAPFSLGVPPCTVNGTAYVPLGLFDALLGSRQGAVTMENGVICLNTDPLNRDSGVQIPNPFVEYETLERAAQAAGLPLTAPTAVNGSDGCVFRAIEGDLLEVIYRKGEDETARVRKAPGQEDISGDYNVYDEVGALDANGLHVTVKGENGLVKLAIWNDGGYTYAVSVAGGISRGDMTALVSAIQ